MSVLFCLFGIFISVINGENPLFPMVLNTWPWPDATDAGYNKIIETDNALDAVVAGCQYCQNAQCDDTVGYGGSPDTTGNTTLDAMIMYGPTHDVGSVGGIRTIRDAIGLARGVLEYSFHTLLVGSSAEQFGVMIGFEEQSLITPNSLERYENWVNNNCQPNFYKNVVNKTTQCPPYEIEPTNIETDTVTNNILTKPATNKDNHDTIGMIAVDSNGNIAVGTSTNGANHKIAGRVGDSPIVGSGAYVDQDIGACTQTGDGDTMMRFSPTFYAVTMMEFGFSPSEAAQRALEKILKYYNFAGAIICIKANGEHGGASYNFNNQFSYAIRTNGMTGALVVSVPDFGPNKDDTIEIHESTTEEEILN